jgi:hypothetical protein
VDIDVEIHSLTLFTVGRIGLDGDLVVDDMNGTQTV